MTELYKRNCTISYIWAFFHFSPTLRCKELPPSHDRGGQQGISKFCSQAVQPASFVQSQVVPTRAHRPNYCSPLAPYLLILEARSGWYHLSTDLMIGKLPKNFKTYSRTSLMLMVIKTTLPSSWASSRPPTHVLSLNVLLVIARIYK